MTRKSHSQVKEKIQDSKASQNQEVENLDLWKLVDISVPKKTKIEYGYNRDLDVVIISKDGTLGSIIEVQGLKIGLPKNPKKVHKRSNKKTDQYWEEFEYPKELRKISTVFQWNEYPSDFKNSYIEYIESLKLEKLP